VVMHRIRKIQRQIAGNKFKFHRSKGLRSDCG
jgi:hypothetical protein